MKSSPEFPLKFLNHYLDKSIHSEWESFKAELIENVFHSPYDKIDEDTFTVRVLNSTTDGMDIYSFESHISKKFEQEVELAVNNISRGFLGRIPYENLMFKYACPINNQYEELINKSKKYPFVSKYLEEIKTILIHYVPGLELHDISKDSSSSITQIKHHNKSIFQLKAGIGIAILKDIYIKAVNHSIINDELTSKENFICVFSGNEGSNQVHFNCKNAKAVLFLEIISQFFEEYSAKMIEDSKIFYTKRGNLLTQSNYNKSKTKISPDSFSALKEDIEEILDRNL